MRVGVVTRAGEAAEIRQAATPPRGEPQALAATVRSLADSLKPIPVDLVGVAVPGVREGARMVRAVNLPALEGVDLGELFGGALGRAVHIETDVNAATLAQQRHAAPQAQRFVYLAIGTGVGAGVLLNGVLLRHTRGGAGLFGHLIVDASADAPLCRCGGRGCLEAHIGGWALAGGEPGERAVEALVTGLLQIAAIYAPECIVLGGGVVSAALVARAQAAFDARRTSLTPTGLTILDGSLYAEQAGVVGAALCAASAS